MERIILCVFFLIIVSSCGKRAAFPDYGQDGVVYYEESEGTYSGKFITLNRQKRFNANLLIWIKGNQFYAKIYLRNGPRKLRYQQYIHKGSRCPQKADDQNKDGRIDIEEVVSASGEILIPLDGFIQEQVKGSNWFPVSKKDGTYYYSRSASVSKMMKDLYSPDRRPDDGLAKLKKNEPLNIAARTVVIYGTPSDPLMPIACAVLKEEY